MAIQRKELIALHNPELTEIDFRSPLTVGNGEIAFTMDVTGMQSLVKQYADANSPLCTMSQWGWHITPVSDAIQSYSLEDVKLTEYQYHDRKVSYAVTKYQDNEEVYSWLRENPHRFHMANIGLLLDGEYLQINDISNIEQSLDLYEGVVTSKFYLQGRPCTVITVCHYEQDTIGFTVHSPLCNEGRLGVQIRFPYGSSNPSGAIWNQPEKHTTSIESMDDNGVCLHRQMDQTQYDVNVYKDNGCVWMEIDRHEYHLMCPKGDTMEFSVSFLNGNPETTQHRNYTLVEQEEAIQSLTVCQVLQSAKEGWERFWQTTGLVRLNQSKDPRAKELERRIILSLYLSRVQCCGSLPPQETGLICNSWHGKFHLEMHFWHMAYLPLWNHGEYLEPTLQWYQSILPKARKNASRNGFLGAKWPKQVGYDGVDSPSPIATLLIWQQPHILYMLELRYQSLKNQEAKAEEWLHKYWKIIEDTASYMVDLVVKNPITGKYELVPPVIPAQETHEPTKTINPIFELEYWRFGLKIAATWAQRLNYKKQEKEWTMVADNMAELPCHNDVYLAHKNCYRTYEEYNKDHPMMLGIFGVIDSDRVDREVMLNTLRKTMQTWDYYSAWGWDFAMMAMTATRLGYPDLAIDLLLMDTANNHYGVNGNNMQNKREDLPAYLPGNGSILLAVALMTAGYEGCNEVNPGFPKNNKWELQWENISPLPY